MDLSYFKHFLSKICCKRVVGSTKHYATNCHGPPRQNTNSCWSNFVCRMAVKQNKAHILKFVPDNFLATSTFWGHSTSQALEEIQEFFKNLFQFKDTFSCKVFLKPCEPCDTKTK